MITGLSEDMYILLLEYIENDIMSIKVRQFYNNKEAIFKQPKDCTIL